MSRIRVQFSFEIDDPDGVLAQWPRELIAAGVGTLIDEGKMPESVMVYDERLSLSIVSAATLARRQKQGGGEP